MNTIGCASRYKAIDVHAHFGTYDSGDGGLRESFMSAGLEDIRRRAQAVDILLTIVSPLKAFKPYEGNVLAANEEALAGAETYPDIAFWVVLDPRRRDSFRQTAEMLGHPRCKGIKIHPVNHNWEIRDRGEEILEFAADHDAVVITHSGCPGSFPEHFVPFADKFPRVRLILAHLGNSIDGNLTRQVNAVLLSQADNIYIDTSSARSLSPRLIEWAVGQVGAGRLLFGSDSPCYFTASQKARIEYAEIDEGDRQAILLSNAARLLGEEAFLS